jgi:CRP/FNR family transcriptional regulator, cyclic AMP receptor protein
MASLSPLLSNFAPEDVAQLSTFGESRSFSDGDMLLTEGVPNHYLYLVLRGRLDVIKKTDDGPRVIAEITTNGSIGDISIFDPGPASATVKANGEVEVWRITQESLDRLHDVRPKVAFRLVSRICTCLAQRLRSLNQRFLDGG